MSKAWRWVGIGTVVVVLAAALELVWEHQRGRRQLEATIAELKAAGTYPDPAVLFAPPGPANGFRTFEQAMSGLSFSPGPEPMQGIAPGRAASSFLKSMWGSSNGRPYTWESLGTWRQDVASNLDSLHLALAQPECRTSVDWRQGFKAPLPAMVRYKQGARALSAAALLAARNGDRAEALRHLTDLRRLESALASQPLLISQLVRIASASIGLTTAWDLAQRIDWTEVDLAALQSALPSTNFCQATVESFRGETSLWEVTLREPDFSPTSTLSDGWGGNQGPLSSPSDLNEVPDFLSELFGRTRIRLQALLFDPLWRYGWRDLALAVHLMAMNELVNRSRSAAESHDLKSFSAEGILPARKLGWYDGLRLNLSAKTLDNLSLALSRALALETQRSLIETHIALRRFVLRHGHAPARLEDLVPEFLPMVPLDGMVGEPLRYRVNSDGSHTVWSVGRDFKDNGGDPTQERSGETSVFWTHGRDTVIPMAVTETELAAWKDSEDLKRRKNGAFRIDPILARRYGLIPKDPTATNSPAPK